MKRSKASLSNEITVALARAGGRRTKAVLAAICSELNCSIDDVVDTIELQNQIRECSSRLFEKYGRSPDETLEVVLRRAPSDDPDVAFLTTPIENDLN